MNWRRRKRHCDMECPRCRKHADEFALDTPKVTGFTTSGQVAVETADPGSEVDVEVTMWCPGCGVAWTGMAVAVAEAE